VREDNNAMARGLLVAAAAVFVVSSYCAGQELRYAFAARTASATVDRMTGMSIGGGGAAIPRGRRVVVVEYHFTDANGTARTGSFDIGGLEPRPARGSALKVEYVPGSSRQAGHLNGGVVAVFLASLVAVLVLGARYRHTIRRALEPT
jgi:hypothetical protein